MESKLRSFSTNGNLFAVCNSTGELKIWDTNSGFLEHEFQPAEYLSSSVTCVKFSPMNFKIKKKKKNEYNAEQLLAMGTAEGTALVYSHTKRNVMAKLTHSSTTPVTDLWWRSGSELVTLGKVNNLIVWNVFTKSKLREIKVAASSSLCILGENRIAVASTFVQLLQVDPKTNDKKEFNLNGHKSSVTQLVPVLLHQDTEAKYVFSAAENDRFVYAWSANFDHKEPVASFMVKDIVKTFTCIGISDSTIALSVTTKKGHLRYFSHHLNGANYSQPVKSVGCLKIYSRSDENSLLPIIGTHFITSSTLTIVYGTDLLPQCERIFVEELKGDVKYIRRDPSLFDKKKVNHVNAVTPHISEDAVYLVPSQTFSSEIKEVSSKRKKENSSSLLPMEERLDSLSVTQSLASTMKGRPMDNYVHLLVQALRSKDANLLSNVLLKGEEDEEMIHSTVKRLPVACVVPFLQYLQEVVAGKGIKNPSFITWIKSVFYHHMSHLSSIPEKEALMQPFQAICMCRMSTLPTITKLHSRISLLLTHVKTRHENAAQKTSGGQSEALLVYKEESSDNEDFNLGISGGHSESEDTWDFLTEDDENDQEPNSPTDDESKLAVKRKKVKETNKNTGYNEDDAISISENEVDSDNNEDDNCDDENEDCDNEINDISDNTNSDMECEDQIQQSDSD